MQNNLRKIVTIGAKVWTIFCRHFEQNFDSIFESLSKTFRTEFLINIRSLIMQHSNHNLNKNAQKIFFFIVQLCFEISVHHYYLKRNLTIENKFLDFFFSFSELHQFPKQFWFVRSMGQPGIFNTTWSRFSCYWIWSRWLRCCHQSRSVGLQGN